MDHSTYEVRLSQWAEIVTASANRPKGVLLKDWLNDNGISRDQFFYWQRKVRSDAYATLKANHTNGTLAPSVSFAEISLPLNSPKTISGTLFSSDIGATLRVNGTTIELSNSASPNLIASILKAIAYA